jgi:hypothetical protein
LAPARQCLLERGRKEARGLCPVIVFGPLVSWIVRALEGAVMVGGLSALGAGLHSIGIPKNNIMEYETAVKPDKFLVIAYGRPDASALPEQLFDS